MKPVQRTPAEVMDELKRFVANWKSTHRLVPAEVVTVLNRSYEPPYTTQETEHYTTDSGKERTRTVTRYHSAKWKVTGLGDQGADTYSVREAEWPLYVVDKPATRWVTIGRWTGWSYSRTITPITVSLARPE